MSTGPAIAVSVLLLALNAFFVGAEFALISARRSSIEPRAASSWAARVTVRAMEQVSLMMAGAQLGITVCSLGLGALGEPAVAYTLEPLFAAVGLPAGLLHPVAFAIALLIVVFLHVTVGEMVPKNIALAVPDRAALVLAPPLMAIVTVLRPFLALLNGIANVTLRAFRVTPTEEVASAFTRDEVAGMVEQSQRQGLLDDDEAELVSGALTFAERTVASVAVPAGSVVSVPPTATIASVEALAHGRRLSRLPVADDDGGWRGYVHVKDLLGVPADERDRPLPARLVRPLRALDPDTDLTEALATMRRSGAHLALVSGPSAPTGLVALDDVLTELVGDIRHAGTR